MSISTQSFDTLLIGGGVIGCSIAWRLAQAGLSVALIERGEPGREASWAAGGMLAPLAEADQPDAFLELSLASRSLYPLFAEELCAASGTDIEYRTEGTLYLALTDSDEHELEHRFQWQRAAGLNVKKLQASCTRKIEPALNNSLSWALNFPDDHQVNPRQLALALARAAQNAGVTFFNHTNATKLLTIGKRVNGAATDHLEIRATTTIVTAGAWSSQIAPAVPTEPIRGQMIALAPGPIPIQHVVYSCRGYVIPRAAGFVVAGSTTERVGFDKSVTESGVDCIINGAVEIAPQLAQSRLLEAWAGLRPKNVRDSWPALGQDPHYEGLLYATGHYRNGILLTPITAHVISELVLRGTSSINLQPFSPARMA